MGAQRVKFAYHRRGKIYTYFFAGGGRGGLDRYEDSRGTTATCQCIILHFGGCRHGALVSPAAVGMTLFIFIGMPTFAVSTELV